MFFFNPKEKTYMKPEVYVLLKDGIVQDQKARIFVKNSALVKFSLNNEKPSFCDTWAFTYSNYFDNMTKNGYFIPIEDLREADELCEKFGLTMEEID